MSLLKEIALGYHNRYGFNVLPLKGKAPIIPWDKWQTQLQTAEDVKRMNWRSASGIGIVQGIDNLAVIDIDGLDNFDILPQLLSPLGLPEDYRWITESGSGRGLHITFYLDDPALIRARFGDSGVLTFKLREENICDHIEIRMKNCQTAFPPSVHPDTRTCYSFFDPWHEPNEKPLTVPAEKLIELINTLSLHPTSLTLPVSKPAPKENPLYELTSFDKSSLGSALGFLSQNLTKGSYNAWFRVGMALVTLGEKGEELFVDMSVNNPHFRDNEDDVRAKFRQFAASSRGSITLSTVYYIAEQYGWKRPAIIFWSVVNGKIRLSETGIQALLQSEGFCKVMIEKEYIFARVRNYLVEETTIPMIKDFVKDYILSLTAQDLDGVSREALLTTVIKRSPSFFTPQFLEFLTTRIIDFTRDTAEKSIIFYRNGALVISKEATELVNYNTFGRYIWKSQILDRSYSPTTRVSDFETFLRRAVNEKEDRFNALRSTIGYLLHRYKDPTRAHAIIFMDEQNSDGAYGRCGKGLLIQGISHIRNTVFLDGRNFLPGKNFAFQRVAPDTDLIALEDLDKKFPFDKLFSVITDGITVERKNKSELFISFRYSPKLILSTNFTVPGIDDSTIARQVVNEFSKHYNMKHRPIDEFNKIFFHDWNEAEWEAFDNFMANCLKYYLEKGIVHYKHINLDTKRLIDETSPEFIEFIESELSPSLYTEFNKKELHASFIGQYPDFAKLKQNTFSRWLKTYAHLKELNIVERKSANERFIELIPKQE